MYQSVRVPEGTGQIGWQSRQVKRDGVVCGSVVATTALDEGRGHSAPIKFAPDVRADEPARSGDDQRHGTFRMRGTAVINLPSQRPRKRVAISVLRFQGRAITTSGRSWKSCSGARTGIRT